MDKKWDFKGWATRHNVLCGDGRTIKESAFVNDDKKTVPLVWNHNHTDADNVLGHALLEYRKEGVYTYGKFNDTEQGINAKKLVRNGDITALSIYANKLKQNKGDVVHGNIRELSLVLAGANPGAYIETVLVHSDSENEEAKIFNNSELEVMHGDDLDNEDAQPYVKENNESNKGDDEQQKDVSHAENNSTEGNEMDKKEKTIQEVYDTLNEEQKINGECSCWNGTRRKRRKPRKRRK